jgi:hypothetical protein
VEENFMAVLFADAAEIQRVVAIVLVSCAITVTVVFGRMIKRGWDAGGGVSVGGILSMALVMALCMGVIIGVIGWLNSV